MDMFGSRASLLAVIETHLSQIHKERKAASVGQVGLFDAGSSSEESKADDLPDVPELSNHELLSAEKELLGFYLTAHPLEKIMDKLSAFGATPMRELDKDKAGEQIKLVGLLTQVKKIITKSGNQEMAFGRIEDLTGNIEVVVFPKLYAQVNGALIRDTVVFVSGKLDEKEDRLVVLADTVRPIDTTGRFRA